MLLNVSVHHSPLQVLWWLMSTCLASNVEPPGLLQSPACAIASLLCLEPTFCNFSQHRATPPLSCLVEILPQIGQVGLNDSGDDLQQCNDFVFRGRADFRCSICSKHFKAFLVPCCIWIYHPEGMDFLRLGSYFVIVVSWKKLFKNRDCGKRKTNQLQ